MKSMIKQTGNNRKRQEVAAAELNDQVYYRLVKRFPLRPLHTEQENDRAAEICDELTDRLPQLSLAERDYLEVLSDLVIKYESRWDNELNNMSPRNLIAYLIKQNNLNQCDLVEEFGTPSRVSEFLNGKRKLSLEQAKKLSERFKLRLTALLED